MAKKPEQTEEVTTDIAVYEEEAFAALLELLSPEDRAAMLDLTGQNGTGGGGIKTPVIRVNYNGKADTTSGKKIARGNFVIGQVVKYEGENKKTVIEAGTDLGEVLDAPMLVIGTQYSFYSEKAGERCSSQIIMDSSEQPIGSNLGKVCSDGTCPRRQEGLHKDDKCGNQFVAFFRLPEDTVMPDGTPAPIGILYIKGINYMPFKEYLNDIKAKKLPCFAFNTVLKTEDQDTYFDLIPSMGKPVSPDMFKANFETVKKINSNIEEIKAQHKVKSPKALPNTTPLSGKDDDGAASKAAQIPANTGDINW